MDYVTMSDEKLMAVYYACDDNAFDELQRRYYQRLVAHFRRLLLLEDADDLAEEVFLRVARTKTKWSRFDPSKGSFETWLYTIARHVAIDHLRKQQREVQIAQGAGEEQSQSPIEQVPSAAPTPEELLVAQTFSEPVHACLAGLALLHREVLLLADLEDFNLAEIVAILEIPYGTAGRRLHDARERMRICLAGKGYRFVPRGSMLPQGALIVLIFPDELLVYIDETQEGA
jgi:RNA polymerase sigma-70 factor (ECF subfamily)